MEKLFTVYATSHFSRVTIAMGMWLKASKSLFTHMGAH